MNDDYQKILDRQEKYGISITNNAEFNDFIISDYEGFETFEDPVDLFDERMLAGFNNATYNLTNLNCMNAGIYALFWWRSDLGMEYPVYDDEPYYPVIEPGIFTDDTATLYDIYTNYQYQNCCDSRPINYCPLIDRIISWMDETYGGEQAL